MYELRDRALQAIGEALSPRQAGRPTQTTTLEVDKALAETQEFVLWTWPHRPHLNLETDIPEPLRAVVRTVWEILGLFHRSSSLAEALHGWLRPYLQIHRGMPKWLPPLLQLFWNHHPFERGKRTGRCPLELAGVKDVPSLAEALGQLFRSEAATRPA